MITGSEDVAFLAIRARATAGGPSSSNSRLVIFIFLFGFYLTPQLFVLPSTVG